MYHMPSKLQTESHEQNQTEDLKSQPSHHNVYARCGSMLITSRRSDSSADRLQDQRREIAAHECYVVCSRTESRVLGTVDDDESCEAEVKRCGEEGWPDGKADEIACVRETCSL